MSTQEDLLLELTILKAQIHNIVYKRLQKVAVRWLFGIPLYYFFWEVTWMRYLFWFSLGAEVILLIFTITFYIKTKPKIQRIEALMEVK